MRCSEITYELECPSCATSIVVSIWGFETPPDDVLECPVCKSQMVEIRHWGDDDGAATRVDP